MLPMEDHPNFLIACNSEIQPKYDNKNRKMTKSIPQRTTHTEDLHAIHSFR